LFGFLDEDDTIGFDCYMIPVVGTVEQRPFTLEFENIAKVRTYIPGPSGSLPTEKIVEVLTRYTMDGRVELRTASAKKKKVAVSR
jgi:hypothetical protein